MPVVKRVSLTAAAVADAKPADKLYRLRDAKVPGLVLRVTPTGRKAWAVTWGRGQEYILGDFPTMTTEAARAACVRALAEISEHGAPAGLVAKRRNLARADGTLIVTLRDFIDHRLEDHLRTHNKAWRDTLGRLRRSWAKLLDKPMSEITPWEVERERAARLKAGVSIGTCNRDLVALKSALSRALAWDLIDVHPLTKVKPKSDPHSGVVRYLGSIEGDPHEERRLRKALAARDAEAIEARARTVQGGRAQHADLALIAPDGFADHLTPMVLMAMNTGLRLGELTAVTWADVDLKRKLLTVQAGYAKSGKARHIPLNSEAVDALRRWKRQNAKGRLFQVGIIKTSWSALLKRARIRNFRFHDLRHHFASRLVQSGVDLNSVRALLGHADLAMTLRYAHLAPSNTAEAVERLVAS